MNGISLCLYSDGSSADLAGGSSIYAIPSNGSVVSIFDGTNMVQHDTSVMDLPLDPTSGHSGYHQSGKIFDVFAFDAGGGVVAIGTGPAWATDTLRGAGSGSTELEMFFGTRVNKVSINLRTGDGSGDVVTVGARMATYLGSFLATANGQASNTRRQRLVYNAANKSLKNLRVSDPVNTWNYSLQTYVQANGNANNQVEVLFGLDDGFVDLTANTIASCSATNNYIQCAIGLDGDAPAFDGITGLLFYAGVTGMTHAHYRGNPGLGKHVLKWLVAGTGSGTQTFYGSNFDTRVWRIGLVGSVLI